MFQFVVQMAGAIVLVLLDEGPLHQFLLTLDFQLTGVAAVHFTMVALLLLTVLYGAIFLYCNHNYLEKALESGVNWTIRFRRAVGVIPRPRKS